MHGRAPTATTALLDLCDRHGIAVSSDVDLAHYSYMKTGGTARHVLRPQRVDDLVALVRHLTAAAMPFKIIGNTSNILFLDRTDYALLICTTALDGLTGLGTTIVAECGAPLPELSRRALYQGLTGMEGLEGIPGTVGAGIFMNAGAYGSEIKDTLVAVDFLDAGGDIVRLAAADLGLKQRSSALREGSLSGVVLRAYFEAKPGDVERIYRRMERYHEKRHRYQEFQYPNLGSLFSASPYDALARRDPAVRRMMRYDIWRRRFRRYLLGGTPTDRRFLNDYILRRYKLAFPRQPFSDKTMNCLVNRGQGTDAMLAYIETVQALTGAVLPLENEILQPF